MPRTHKSPNKAPWTDAERAVLRRPLTEREAAAALRAELGTLRSISAVGTERRRLRDLAGEAGGIADALRALHRVCLAMEAERKANLPAARAERVTANEQTYERQASAGQVERPVRPPGAEASPLVERRGVKPAFGYKHHAERVRNTGAHMEATAEFIEAQNAEIEYLYAALQQVRNRVGGSRRNNATALDVLAIADAALKYEA